MMRHLLSTALFLCFIVAAKAQTTLILKPGRNGSNNAVITDWFPSTNYTVDSIFQGSAWTIGGTAVLFRSLLQFDLSQIPSDATVDSAFLSLYGFIGPDDFHYPLSGSNESVLMRVTSPWNENTVTWNNQPTTIATDQVTLPISNFSGEDYLHYDIKNLVQYWVSNPATNYGMLCKLVTEQYYRRISFCSPGIADSTKRPMLKIHYTIRKTSVNSIGRNDGIVIVPNPSIDHINISLHKSINGGEMCIFNQLGQKVYAEPFNGTSKKVHFNLSAGIYFVQVRDHEAQYNQKIIIGH